MEPKVVVNGKEYPLVTVGELTLGEAAEIESITGQGYDMETDLGPKGVMAMIYISVKRVDASVTIADIQGLRGGDFDFLVEEGDPVPPTSSGETAGLDERGSEGSSQDSVGSQEATQEPTGTPV